MLKIQILFILCPIIVTLSALSADDNGLSRVGRRDPSQLNWTRKPLPPRRNRKKPGRKPTSPTPPTAEPWIDERPTEKPYQNHEVDFVCNDDGYHAIPNECNSYIDCRYHKAMKYYCKDGKHFDSTLRDSPYPCSEPWEAQCERDDTYEEPKPRPRPPKKPNSSSERVPALVETIGVITPEGKTETSSSDIEPPVKPTKGPIQGRKIPNYPCKDDGYHAVDGECNSYIDCRYYKARLYYCEDGDVYNPELKLYRYPCSKASKGQCTPDSTSMPSEPVDVIPPLQNSTSMNDTSTNGISTNGTSTNGTSENNGSSTNGTSVDNSISTNDTAVNNGTSMNDTSMNNDTSTNGTSVNNGTSANNSSMNGTSANNGTSTNDTSISNGTSINNGTSTNTSTAEEPSKGKFYGHETNFTCTKDGYYAVPDECDSYIDCIFNISMKYYCKEGHHFNPEAQHLGYPCTDPVKAQCSSEDKATNVHQNPDKAGLRPFHEPVPAYHEMTSIIDPVPIRHTEPSRDPAPERHTVPSRDPASIRHTVPSRDSAPKRHTVPSRDPAPKRHTVPSRDPAPKRHTEPSEDPAPKRHIEPSRDPAPKRHTVPSRDRFTSPKPTIREYFRPTPPPRSLVSRTTKKPLKEKTKNPLAIDFPCRHDGYFAISNSCESYIECANNEATRHRCRNGLQFNPAIKYGKYPCSKPSVVKCKDGASLVKEHENQDKVGRKPVHKRVPAYHETVSIIDPVPVEKDPSRHRSTSPRPSTLHHSTHVHNTPTSPKPSTFHKTTHAPYSPTTPNYPLVRWSTEDPQIGKNNDPLVISNYTCKGDGYYAVAKQCDSYIECSNNVATKNWCRDGLHFNPAAKYGDFPCSYPAEVKCNPGDYVQSPKASEYCPQQYGFFRLDDIECSRYVNCQEGLPIIMHCPPGLAFNEKISNCDWPINVPPCNPNVFKDFVCPAVPTGHDTFANVILKYRYEHDCSYYIACQEGRPRLLKCDAGTFFDSTTKSCISSNLVTDCTNKHDPKVVSQ